MKYLWWSSFINKQSTMKQVQEKGKKRSSSNKQNWEEIWRSKRRIDKEIRIGKSCQHMYRKLNILTKKIDIWANNHIEVLSALITYWMKLKSLKWLDLDWRTFENRLKESKHKLLLIMIILKHYKLNMQIHNQHLVAVGTVHIVIIALAKLVDLLVIQLNCLELLIQNMIRID